MATSKAAIDARRARVAEYLLARWSFRRMAEALGVSLGTIATDVTAIRADWREQRADAFADLVAGELARLNVAESAIWGEVASGKLLAVDRLLAIQDRRAKLLGLDAPSQQQVTGQLNVVWQGADPRDV